MSSGLFKNITNKVAVESFVQSVFALLPILHQVQGGTPIILAPVSYYPVNKRLEQFNSLGRPTSDHAKDCVVFEGLHILLTRDASNPVTNNIRNICV